MHKLKVYSVVATADVNPEVVDDLGCAEWEAYDKSEVDKEIEDIVQGAISMFRESSCCRGLDLKSSLGQIADVAFRHWNQVENTLSNNRRLRLDKDHLLWSNKQLRDELKSQTTARQTDKLKYNLCLCRHKHKRCLAMADFCESQHDYYNTLGNGLWLVHGDTEKRDEYRKKASDFWWKWHKYWLELADKFREVK